MGCCVSSKLSVAKPNKRQAKTTQVMPEESDVDQGSSKLEMLPLDGSPSNNEPRIIPPIPKINPAKSIKELAENKDPTRTSKESSVDPPASNKQFKVVPKILSKGKEDKDKEKKDEVKIEIEEEEEVEIGNENKIDEARENVEEAVPHVKEEALRETDVLNKVKTELSTENVGIIERPSKEEKNKEKEVKEELDGGLKEEEKLEVKEKGQEQIVTENEVEETVDKEAVIRIDENDPPAEEKELDENEGLQDLRDLVKSQSEDELKKIEDYLENQPEQPLPEEEQQMTSRSLHKDAQQETAEKHKMELIDSKKINKKKSKLDKSLRSNPLNSDRSQKTKKKRILVMDEKSPKTGKKSHKKDKSINQGQKKPSEAREAKTNQPFFLKNSFDKKPAETANKLFETAEDKNHQDDDEEAYYKKTRTVSSAATKNIFKTAQEKIFYDKSCESLSMMESQITQGGQFGKIDFNKTEILDEEDIEEPDLENLTPRSEKVLFLYKKFGSRRAFIEFVKERKDDIFEDLNEMTGEKIPKNGLGKLVFENGDQYIGEFRDGQCHGRGQIKFINGDLYRGDFKNGFMHGKGEKILESGDTYIGDFFHDFMHGHGVFLSKDGSRYEGTFAADSRTGKGLLRLPNEDTYKGEFLINQFHGKGELKTIDLHYKGRFKNNKPDGRGVMKYGLGLKNIHEGAFKEGLKHGEGKMTNSEGKVYRTTWVNGKKHGVFFLISPDSLSEGIFENDQIVGDVTIHFKNGDTYSGGTQRGYREGKGRMVWGSHRVLKSYEGDFRGNLMHGKGKIEFRSGLVYKGPFVYNKMHGSGMIKTSFFKGKGKFEKGAPVGSFEIIYKNGDIYRGGFAKFKPNGRGKLERKGKKVAYLGEFVNGIKHGEGTLKTERLKYKGEWVRGLKDGSFVVTDLKTRKQKNVVFSMGICQESSVFDMPMEVIEEDNRSVIDESFSTVVRWNRENHQRSTLNFEETLSKTFLKGL